jgi:TRAP-type C4-dicarboxylate transport system permease small subunit
MNNSATQVSTFNSVLSVVNKISVYISAGILTFISILIVMDVLLRFIFNAPLPAATEICTLLMPYIAFLPFAYTLAAGQHVRLTLLTGRLPLKLRAKVEAFVYIVCFIFFSILFWYSWLAFWEALRGGEIMPAIITIPWWIGKLAMPVGVLLIAAQCILSFIVTFNQKEEE